MVTIGIIAMPAMFILEGHMRCLHDNVEKYNILCNCLFQV